MAYALHQPINTTTGAKIGQSCERDGVFVDVPRNRADVLIVDERAPYNIATHVATDTEVAEPWPFNPATTQWKLKRTVRSKTAQELADEDKENTRVLVRTSVLQHAQITITLIDKLIQKGTITALDFDAATRAQYQALKASVDTLR